jgi:hypothetical protein
MHFTVTLSDKYASGEASEDNCEAYLLFCESNDTLPRALSKHKDSAKLDSLCPNDTVFVVRC